MGKFDSDKIAVDVAGVRCVGASGSTVIEAKIEEVTPTDNGGVIVRWGHGGWGGRFEVVGESALLCKVGETLRIEIG